MVNSPVSCALRRLDVGKGALGARNENMSSKAARNDGAS